MTLASAHTGCQYRVTLASAHFLRMASNFQCTTKHHQLMASNFQCTTKILISYAWLAT
jgi:hypothetical protein